MKKNKYLIISLVLLIIDQISKYFVMTNIKLNKSIVIIPNFFKLTYTNNHGAAFSILEGKQVLIIIISIIVFIYLCFFTIPYNTAPTVYAIPPSTSSIVPGIPSKLINNGNFTIIHHPIAK